VERPKNRLNQGVFRQKGKNTYSIKTGVLLWNCKYKWIEKQPLDAN